MRRLILLATAAACLLSACPTDQPGPPAAPSDLTADPVAASSVTLTWRDNSTNETGFTIVRAVSDEISYSEVGTVSADVTVFVDSSVTPGTTYSYAVCAYNSGGISLLSDPVEVTTPSGSAGTVVGIWDQSEWNAVLFGD